MKFEDAQHMTKEEFAKLMKEKLKNNEVTTASGLAETAREQIAELMADGFEEAKKLYSGTSREERMADLSARIAATAGMHAQKEGEFSVMCQAIGDDAATGILCDSIMKKLDGKKPDELFNDLSGVQKVICCNIVRYVIFDSLRSGAVRALNAYKREIFGESTEE